MGGDVDADVAGRVAVVADERAVLIEIAVVDIARQPLNVRAFRRGFLNGGRLGRGADGADGLPCEVDAAGEAVTCQRNGVCLRPFEQEGEACG